MLRSTDWWLFTDASGQPICPIFKVTQSGWLVEIEPVGCPETSENNHETELCLITEERRPSSHCGESLKSRKILYDERTGSKQGL